MLDDEYGMIRIQVAHLRSARFIALVAAEGLAVMGVWWLLTGSAVVAFFFGGTCFLAVASVMRFAFRWRHLLGLDQLRFGQFEKAIRSFQKCEAFYAKHTWIDQYRFLTMFSVSAVCCRESALFNLATGYRLAGQPQKALETYERLLTLYPNSVLTSMVETEKRRIAAE